MKYSKTLDMPIDQTQAGIDNIKTQISILECAISDFKAEQGRIIIEWRRREKEERRRREEEERRRKAEEQALAKLHLNLLELIKNCREHILFIKANANAKDVEKIHKLEEIICKILGLSTYQMQNIPDDEITRKIFSLSIYPTQEGIRNIQNKISILEDAISNFKAEQEKIRIEKVRKKFYFNIAKWIGIFIASSLLIIFILIFLFYK